MSEENKGPIKVLFLAWGYSIHAKRRVQVFIDDPGFEVAVASTYDYNFANAQNYLLSKARPQQKAVGRCSAIWRSVKVVGRYLSAFVVAWRIFKTSGVLAEAGGVRSHLALLKKAFFSPEIHANVKRAVGDFRVLQQSVEEFEPDVIFLQTLLYPCYLTFFLPREIPVVITFWNGDVTWWAQWLGIERLLKKQMVEYGVGRAKAMTVNSQTAYDACLEYGVSEEKVHLIRYPGVDLDQFKPSSQEVARQRLGIEHGKVILCPRGLGQYLNSDVIIEAAAAVINEIPGVLFLFISGAGGDDEWQRHLQRANELGIAGHLRRDGQIPWEKMPLYYHAADVVVSISSNDSLPNCMIEAMACGVPVVMGDIPPIREWVEDQVNGLLVPVRDAVMLSQALLAMLQSDNSLVAKFVEYNIDLANREFNGRKNSQMVKALVANVVNSDEL